VDRKENFGKRKEQNTMKERPIIFSAESVKAILDGRKTQTRRVAKGVGYINEYREIGWEPAFTTAKWYTSIAIDRDGMEVPGKEVFGVHSEDGEYGLPCPYGAPGDRLWVREKFIKIKIFDKEQALYSDTIPPELMPVKWESPMYMPRKYSRLTLEIVNVRCEQLKSITRNDVQAEGYYEENSIGIDRLGFIMAWNALNAKRGFGWDRNPWVWVLEFKQMKGEPNDKETERKW
jgi:hypothetical protein